jgi:predicted ester cyclase
MPGAAARLVGRFYDEVWNRADEAVAREILHPAFRFRASLGPERTGPDGFIAYLRAVHAALGAYTCVVEELVACEGRTAARMRFSGLHRGAFFGVAATGRTITWAGAAFFHTDATQIASLWVLGDVDGVKQQLGAAAASRF